METGLEDIELANLNKEVDIFDTMDEIKKQVEETTKTQKASTIGAIKNQSSMKEKKVNEIAKQI